MSENVSQQSDPPRFEITVDGTTAGFAEYVDHAGQRIFFHTEIQPEFGGRGLAGTVVGRAFEATRDEGLRIVAVCSFVQRYVSKHPEWQEWTDPATPAALAAIPAG